MTKLHIQRLAAAAAAVVISMAGGALCAQQYGGEGFYPAGCVDDTSCLPLPGEAPLSYFGRTLNMTRGPYGHYAETQYPEDCSTLAPPGVDISRAPPTHQEQFASFNADPSELSQSYTEDYQDLVPGGDCCALRRNPRSVPQPPPLLVLPRLPAPSRSPSGRWGHRHWPLLMISRLSSSIATDTCCAHSRPPRTAGGFR